MAFPWMATGLVGWAINGSAWQLFPVGLLLAQAEPRDSPVPRIDPWALWWHYLALLGFALVGILALYLITRWRKRAASDRLSASEQLSEFRELYEQGHLSQEEFDRLRTLLGDRMKREMEGKLATPAADAPEVRPPDEAASPKPEAPESGIRPADPA
jgi:hypothetical protein